LIGTGPGAGAVVIFKQSGFKILMVIFTVQKLWQESNRIRSRFWQSGVITGAWVNCQNTGAE